MLWMSPRVALIVVLIMVQISVHQPRRALAVAAYGRTRGRIRKDLGVDLASETEAIYLLILAPGARRPECGGDDADQSRSGQTTRHLQTSHRCSGRATPRLRAGSS